MDWLSSEALAAFLQVVFIDLVLAGDNAVVIGMAAAGLPVEERRRAVLIGLAAATVLRIGFASITVELLEIIGLMLAGGILLLWVCWKMWRELREGGQALEAPADGNPAGGGTIAARAPRKTLYQAACQIVLADVSMSLDNVLAVAGAAHQHPIVLVFGLALSVVLMGAAAVMIANLLQRHRWIAYVGLGIILIVALRMIEEGFVDVYLTVHGD